MAWLCTFRQAISDEEDAAGLDVDRLVHQVHVNLYFWAVYVLH